VLPITSSEGIPFLYEVIRIELIKIGATWTKKVSAPLVKVPPNIVA
jgi:hypothetical protein